MANGWKTGGRKAGTPNRVTNDLREALQGVLETEIGLIPKHLAELDTRDRLAVLVKLLPYVLPRVTAGPVSEEPGDQPGALIVEIPVTVDVNGNRLNAKDTLAFLERENRAGKLG